VAQAKRSYLSTLKALFWAGLWSTVLTTVIILAIAAYDRCFLIVNAASWVWIIATLIWIWLSLFLIFGKRGRLILMGCSVLLLLGLAVSSDPFQGTYVAAGEASVVAHLLGLVQSIESYRKEYPLEGYPPNLPKISSSKDMWKAERMYKINYTTSRSNPSGPTGGFLIQATPVWRECGYGRSFAATDDGQIHVTIEMRPATKTDAAIFP